MATCPPPGRSDLGDGSNIWPPTASSTGTLPVRQGFDLDSNIPGLNVNENIGRVPSKLANA
jgi:hypothetical protein